MKRVIAVILLVLVASMAFGKSVDEADGNDWVQWHPTARGFFIIGYAAGVYTALVMLHQTHEGDMPRGTAEVFIRLQRLGQIPLGLVIQRLDEFYADPERRAVPIFQAVFLVLQGWQDDRT